MNQLQFTVANLTERMDDVESRMVQVQSESIAFTAGMGAEKREVVGQFEQELDGHKFMLTKVVNDARDEFLNVKQELTGLTQGTEVALRDAQSRLAALEAASARNSGSNGAGNSSSTRKDYLPAKTLMPKVFGDKEEEWARWQYDFLDYVDTVRPGMREFLKQAEKAPVADDDWLWSVRYTHSTDVTDDKVEVYRVLKALTAGEARMVVLGVRDQNGFNAWRQMHMRYGLSAAAKQGKVMSEVAMMATRMAKNPAETRSLVTELEKRVRAAEEITGRPLDGNHQKSILVSLLDPTTRAHTSTLHGTDTSYMDLEVAVLELAKNNTPQRPSVEAAHACAEQDYIEGEEAEEEWPDDGQVLAAVGPHTQCYNCHQYGHMANRCPTKGKGKIKGGDYKGGNFGKGDNSGKGGGGGGYGGKGG